jgi:Protein of unknown function (DUF4238)
MPRSNVSSASRVRTRAHTVPKFYLAGFVSRESASNPDPFMWVGSLKTGEITRRSPKNISIARGLYDGQGAFLDPGATVEARLAKIESAASTALRNLAASPAGTGVVIPPEIWRFIAWQVARTPGYMDLFERWINEGPFGLEGDDLEAPPPGFEEAIRGVGSLCLEDPTTRTRHEIIDVEEITARWKQGWKVILRHEDHLILLPWQAWYFEVRHFRRLKWKWLRPPDGQFFITSDRAVAWLGDRPPAALKRSSAHVFAPLTRDIALIGRHGTDPVDTTPRGVNFCIASAASAWIAGPTSAVVRQAILDRAAFTLELAAEK